VCLPAASLKSCPPSAFVPAHAYAYTAVTAVWWNSGNYLGCYFMHGRAALTALLQAARLLAGQDALPAGDVHLVFPTNEEIGGVGGLLRLRLPARRSHDRL
jgi:putative aminopeptidase FrvX